MTLWQHVKHIDLREIASRVSPENQAPARVSKKPYIATSPGKADMACVAAVFAMKDLWRDGPRDLRMGEIEEHKDVRAVPEGQSLLAASLKRLDRIGQVKLDFDRDGVIVRQGGKWIET